MLRKKLGTVLSPLSCQQELEQLIKNSLCSDWALYLEIMNAKSNCEGKWKQWGTTHFALHDANPVLEAIQACRISHPNHFIRIFAKKYRPNTELIYSVYSPPQESTSKQNPNPTIKILTQPSNGLSKWSARKLSLGQNQIWQAFLLIAAVVGSILLIESTMAS
ncbi:MAG: ribulose bisphosphate carboxylase small subunit [Gammaproteobacteria bacterium]|nr:ribulose bisphosphate carboxylase small subunit [Gammaproteobacteria bacterium]